MLRTLYVDETGVFKRASSGVTGLRLVGGLLIPGTPEQHDAALGSTLRQALDWYPPPVHAVQVANAYDVARSLRRASPMSLPATLRPLRKQLLALPQGGLANLRLQPDLFNALLAESQRLLDSLRAAVGLAFASHAAVAVLCAEHDLRPAASRYDDMLHAAVEAALIHCAWRYKSHTELHVVIESGGAEHDPSAFPLSLDVQGAKSEAGLVPPPRYAAKSEKLAGLALTDILLHALGPGGRQGVPWSATWCRRWDLGSNRNRAENLFGRQPRLVVVDALRGGDLLREVRAGSMSPSDAHDALQRHRKKLPKGVLRASLQWIGSYVDSRRSEPR